MNELLGTFEPPMTSRPENEISGAQASILVVGLPGKMATLVVEGLVHSPELQLLPYAITSAREKQPFQEIAGQRIPLLNYCPLDQVPGTIAVDFTTSGSSTVNVINYTQLGIPFVMGTTGGNRQEMEHMVRNSKISAVIAPNMAISVVEIQDELDRLFQTSPDCFDGWHMTISESHQASKRDVSGTAIAFRSQLEKLGAVMEEEIESVRSPERQRELGIRNVDGHAYHWIVLTSPGGDTKEYRTQIEGRQSYVEGTLMAIRFLERRIKGGSHGEVFTMSDVLKDQRRLS